MLLQKRVAEDRKIFQDMGTVRDKGENGGEEAGVSVQLDRQVHAAINAYCKANRRVLRGTVSRIVERFLGAPDAVKTVLLGEVDEGMEKKYAAALEVLAKELRAAYERRKGVGDLYRPDPPPANPSPSDPSPGDHPQHSPRAARKHPRS